MTNANEKGSNSSRIADKLLVQINTQRNQLYLFADSRHLADPEVVQMSQELDRLLNLYNTLIECE